MCCTMNLWFLQGVQVPWRTLQVCIHAITIVTGFCTFLPLGYVTRYFQQRCLLYAHVRISSMDTTTVTVDSSLSRWGDTTNCGFCTYTPVLICAHAFIWTWFYILMKSQLKKENRQFTLLFPAFLLNCLMLICSFVVSNMISVGMDTFCWDLVREAERASTNKHTDYTCSDMEGLKWDVLTEQRRFYTFLSVSRISSWLLVLTVLCQCLVCGYKLYTWFMSNTTYMSTLRECRRFKRPSNDQITEVDIIDTEPTESAPTTTNTPFIKYIDKVEIHDRHLDAEKCPRVDL